MTDLTNWMGQFLHRLDKTFGQRVWFVGLQGSYGRGEATETSDIDMVVILDELSVRDIQIYRAMLDTLPHRELVCGFFAGKQELLCWEPSDLFQFYHDTTPLRGSLEELLPLLDTAAVKRAIRLGVCNLFHGCVHNLLHGQEEDTLRGLYKGASFVIQAIVFQQTGRYLRQQKELYPMAAPEEQRILEVFGSLKRDGVVEFQPMSELLFAWTKAWIENTGGF